MAAFPTDPVPSPADRSRALKLAASVRHHLRGWLHERGFLEMETPALVTSPGLDLHLDAFEVLSPSGKSVGYLTTSPEYHLKRLLAEGFTAIYRLGPVYRWGESGHRHNPEFCLLEFYRAHTSYQELMAETEELVCGVLEKHDRMRLTVEGHEVDASLPFERITVTDAFARFAQMAEEKMLELAAKNETEFFRLWIDYVEPGLAAIGAPTFVHRFPLTQASLAQACPDDPRYCERFELMMGPWEVCNGFGELRDPVEQRRRLVHDQEVRRREGKPIYPVDERFLAALEAGIPPASGNAIGVDRLVALIHGGDDLARVMPFAWDMR